MTTVTEAAVTLQLPASWHKVESDSADATYEDPEKPQYRLWISSYNETLPAEVRELPLETMIRRQVERVPGNRDLTISAKGDDRVSVEYAYRPEGVAPTRNWAIFRRQGDLLLRTLFTLSIYPNHWNSDETVDLVARLSREIAAAQFSPVPATPESGWEARSPESEEALGQLERLHPAGTLASGTAAGFAPDVIAIEQQISNGVTEALAPLHLKPDRQRAQALAIAICVAWLNGAKQPHAEAETWEIDLAKAAEGEAGGVNATYLKTRNGDAQLIGRWRVAFFRGSKGVETRFRTDIALLRELGIDTALGRAATGDAREPWINAVDAVDAAIEDAARLVYQRMRRDGLLRPAPASD